MDVCTVLVAQHYSHSSVEVAPAEVLGGVVACEDHIAAVGKALRQDAVRNVGGFVAAVFLADYDCIGGEVRVKSESLDFVALAYGAAVGDEYEPESAVFQSVEHPAAFGTSAPDDAR